MTLIVTPTTEIELRTALNRALSELIAALCVVKAAQVYMNAPFGSIAENDAQAGLIDAVREWEAAQAEESK